MSERRWAIRSGRATAGLAAACSLSLVLAGCGGFGGGDEEIVTETTTITEADGTGAADGSGGGPEPTTETTTTTTSAGNGRDGSGGGSGGNCGVDENAAILEESIDKVETPDLVDYWDLVETNYDPCGELTYALYQQMPQGNSQFLTKILMFHDGEYLGVDSTYRQQGRIVGEGDGWFEVEYKDWEALAESGEPNAAAPKYTTTVTFRWDESSGEVDVDGEFPNTNLPQ